MRILNLGGIMRMQRTHAAGSSRNPVWLATVVIVGIGLGVYCGNLNCPLVFDDHNAIIHNPSIRALWPPWVPLWPPPDTTLSGRPLVNLSFAINYALGGLNVWGYHLLNNLIHVLTGLTLFGVVRQTLSMPGFGDRFRARANSVALAVALLWVVHPLTTEAVTYVSTRTESLMGLFLLLTLYCAIRGFRSASPGRWYACAISACALGMGSKEVMVAAPLLVYLYDRSFVSGSFRGALVGRKGFYAALASTWLILGVLLATEPRPQSVRFDVADVGPWDYGRTQLGIILHYLRLSLWPDRLVIDYQDWPIVGGFSASVAVQAALVAGLMALTIWGLLRGARLAFLGVWLFLLLLPTSSVVPIVTEIAAERRMYLPLIAIVVLVVLATGAAFRFIKVRGTLQRVFGIGWLLLAVFGLATLTWSRNLDYRSAVGLWSDAVAKRPNNFRAHNNLGTALKSDGRDAEAIEAFREAVRLRPKYRDAYGNLGAALTDIGRLAEGVAAHRKALEVAPDDALTHYNLGNTLLKAGDVAGAVERFREAISLDPDLAQAHGNLAVALMTEGDLDGAAGHGRRAVELAPDAPASYTILGDILARQGRLDEAAVVYRSGVAAVPDDPGLRSRLGTALMQAGRSAEAIPELRQVAALRPEDAGVQLLLGRAYSAHGLRDEAIACYQSAIRLNPDEPQAHLVLGDALIAAGQTSAGAERYRAVLRLRPDTPDVAARLAWILSTDPDSTVRNPEEAVRLAERAASLMGGSHPSALDVLAAAYASAGRFSDAVRTAQRAAGLASSADNEGLARRIEKRLEVYRARRSWIESR